MKLKKKYQSRLNNLFVYETEDGFHVESVFYRGNTLCISTQVGCPIGCRFCASGSKGFFRNLSEEEIKQQYLLLEGKLPIKGIAIAGIGEPSFNVNAVLKALTFFKNRKLKVTITTTGYPDKEFQKLLSSEHDGITLSIHGFSKAVREKLFKLNFPFEKTLSTFENHIKQLSKTKRKKYQLGYLLLDGVNDSKEELSKLAELAKKYSLTVMLMMYNPVETSPFKPVSPERYEECFKFLRKYGIRVTLSNRFRTDPLGGCGTLTIARA
ncbi:radical SAM protein [Desulfurobacterium sp.]